MTFKWKREQIEILIASVQKNTCIYNIKSLEYLDRNKRVIAFNRILEEMQRIEKAITLSEIRRKWRNLRTQYTQELRAMNLSNKVRTNSTEIYVPKLWCFNQLDFLRNHIEVKKSRDNTELPKSESECSTCEEESSVEPTSKKRRKELSAINAQRKDSNNFKNILNYRRTEKKYAWLGTLVANQMEEINPEDQSNAAWQVQCLMRKLTQDSLGKRNSSNSNSSNGIPNLPMDGVFGD